MWSRGCSSGRGRGGGRCRRFVAGVLVGVGARFAGGGGGAKGLVGVFGGGFAAAVGERDGAVLLVGEVGVGGGAGGACEAFVEPEAVQELCGAVAAGFADGVFAVVEVAGLGADEGLAGASPEGVVGEAPGVRALGDAGELVAVVVGVAAGRGVREDSVGVVGEGVAFQAGELVRSVVGRFAQRSGRSVRARLPERVLRRPSASRPYCRSPICSPPGFW